MMLKKTLDVCIQHYLNTREVAMLEDYLDDMPRDEKGKKELLEAIGNYDILALYYVLFEDFAELLTHDELYYYIKKGLETFDENLHLDELIFKTLDRAREKEHNETVELCNEKDCSDESKMTFTVQNDDGEPVECEVLFTLEHVTPGKDYIVYTDNTLTPEGEIKVYASVLSLNEDGETMKLLPIETDEEWELIEKELERLQKE